MLAFAAAMGSAGAVTTARASDAIVVPRDYATIQAAVDAANPGATIIVRRGTYVEEVVIAKDLTIKGEGIDRTVVRAPPSLHSIGVALFNGRPVASIVHVTDGSHVAISDLTIAGPTPCAVNTAGIRAVKNAHLDLTGARVTFIQPADVMCDLMGTLSAAVVIGLPSFVVLNGEASGGSTGHARVKQVAIDQFLSTGIGVSGPFGGPVSTAVIAGNVISGGTPFVYPGQGGVLVNFAATAQVTGNEIAGLACTHPLCGNDPINTAQSFGIGAGGVGVSGTVFEDNVVRDSDVGIYVASSEGCCATRDNRLLGNHFFGIVIQDGNNDAAENDISGGEVGIGVVADAVDTTAILRENKIRQTSVQPVQEISCCGVTATAVIR